MDDRTLPPSLSVTVYSTGPACQRCRLTCDCLRRAGIGFRLIDITREENRNARIYLTEDLGYAEAPVVIVEDEPEHHWSGFRPDLISRLAQHLHDSPVQA